MRPHRPDAEPLVDLTAAPRLAPPAATPVRPEWPVAEPAAPSAPTTTEPAEPAPAQPGTAPAGPATQHANRVPVTAARRPRSAPAPQRGWRRWVHRATRGRVHLGQPPAVRRWLSRQQRIARPLPEGHMIVVLSRKGGVGVTTTTVLLGQVLASVRPSPVVAVDAHTDQGTLADRVSGTSPHSVRTAASASGTSLSQVRELLASDVSRLDVLAHPRDPLQHTGLAVSELQGAVSLLRTHYPLVLCEIGPDLTHPVATAVLAQATAAVVVGADTPDQAHAVLDTLAQLRSRGLEQLATTATLALHAAAAGPAPRAVQQQIQELARPTIHVPRDRHVARGGVICPDQLAQPTREAAHALAEATVAALAPTASTGGDPS